MRTRAAVHRSVYLYNSGYASVYDSVYHKTVKEEEAIGRSARHTPYLPLLHPSGFNTSNSQGLPCSEFTFHGITRKRCSPCSAGVLPLAPSPPLGRVSSPKRRVQMVKRLWDCRASQWAEIAAAAAAVAAGTAAAVVDGTKKGTRRGNVLGL
eukprot:scaffold139032_cov157-Phaeocystis_antarctica.AAC.3